jgi:hypothetical protein
MTAERLSQGDIAKSSDTLPKTEHFQSLVTAKYGDPFGFFRAWFLQFNRMEATR